MTYDMQRVYGIMKNDKEFFKVAFAADNKGLDSEPRWYTDDLTKHLWIATYWGYLIALGRQGEVAE